MRALAELVLGPRPGTGGGYRVERMASEAPVAWRPTPEGVYMVGTAASPVGADDVVSKVTVRAGAEVAIRSTAAMIAWTGSGAGSRHRVEVEVEDGGRLDWRPEPLVATAGCSHEQRSLVSLGAGAGLVWREIVVYGRDGEAAGKLVTHLSVDRGGAPLLRHEMASVLREVWTSPAVMGGHRVAGMLLVVEPGAGEGAGSASASTSGEGWARMPLHAGGTLTLAVGGDVPSVAASLEAAAGV